MQKENNMMGIANGLDQGVYSVDPTTGEATFLPGTGKTLEGLAFFGGTLFGISDDGTDSLVAVNTVTGERTTMGALVNMNADDSGVAFASNGTLRGISGHDDEIFTINTTTGKATGVANPACGLRRIGFIQSEKLFGEENVPCPTHRSPTIGQGVKGEIGKVGVSWIDVNNLISLSPSCMLKNSEPFSRS